MIPQPETPTGYTPSFEDPDPICNAPREYHGRVQTPREKEIN